MILVNKVQLTSVALISMLVLASCASSPEIDPRMTALQAQLSALESDTELVSRGGDALKRARTAVDQLADPKRKWNDEEVAYRFYAADRLIETSRMTARAKLAEDRRKALLDEQERLVLEARTMEANIARKQAQTAQQSAAEAVALREQALAEAAAAQQLRDDAQAAQMLAERSTLSALTEAEEARAEAEAARADAEAARAEMESMRNRLSELEAKQTERGLLITLGDVLFELNKSELKAGSARNLLPLANVLKERPDQPLIIEGHTDSTGARAYNMTLSEQRAQAVADYLADQGVTVNPITISGLGPDFPVADNGSSEGRQRNRRVDVILPNLQ